MRFLGLLILTLLVQPCPALGFWDHGDVRNSFRRMVKTCELDYPAEAKDFCYLPHNWIIVGIGGIGASVTEILGLGTDAILQRENLRDELGFIQGFTDGDGMTQDRPYTYEKTEKLVPSDKFKEIRDLHGARPLEKGE